MEAIQQQIDLPVLQGKAQALIARAKAHRITSQAGREVAAMLRSKMKGLEKGAEAYRVWHTKPLNVQVKAINDSVRPLKEALTGGVEAIDVEIVRDHQEQKRIAEEERRKAEAEATRLRAEAAAEAKREADQRAQEAASRAAQEAQEAGFSETETQEYAESVKADEEARPVEVAPVPVPVAPAPPPKTTVAESGASTTLRKDWDFEVVNVSRLPVDYILADEKKIRDFMRLMVKEGTPPNMDGVRFFQKDTIAQGR